MNQWTTLYAPLLGRILLGGFFVWTGVQKALNFPGVVEFFTQLQYPAPLVMALLVMAFEVVGGIALVADMKTRFVAALLALYVVLTSILFMSAQTTNMQVFLQSMAIVGGLLMTTAYGTSRWTPSWQR